MVIYGHTTDRDTIWRPYEVTRHDTAAISYDMVISIYGNIHYHIADTI
jgi:hypothetical protein